MKIRLIILHILSLLTFVILIYTSSVCKDLIGYESLGDSGLILVASPFFLFVVGTIRILVSKNSGFKTIYRFQEYFYAASIFALLFLISMIDSMLLGLTFSIIFMVSTLTLSYSQHATILKAFEGLAK